MPYDFQVTIDAAEPHPLAAWWAQTLGWAVEPQDEDFIRRMIAEGYATEAETMTYNGSLVWSSGAAINHPEGGRPRVLFQQVPEAKSGKNRLHLDVRVGEENVDAAVAELTARGATYLHKANQGPHWWITMADPEGNEFCVT
ncbi:MAG TPA: VOC family protein [Streptosporangiaceae bacterium]|nr:VOC family protein [Streptosporangiaceae bacterium]